MTLNLRKNFWIPVTLFIAGLQPATAQQVILQENFESLSATQALPKGWTQFSTDGDAYGWAMNAGMADLTCGGRGGGRCIASASYAYDDGALHPDNYLVTPMLTDAAKVVYYVCAQDVTAIQEHYAVMASKTSTAASDFSIVYEETLSNKPSKTSSMAHVIKKAQSDWIKREVELPAGTKYVAFRHFNSSDNFVICLDDVTIYNHAAATSYGIVVGGIEVTNANASDVLRDGTVAYDVASRTITMNKASIKTDDIPALNIIAKGKDAYTLKLAGADTIISKTNNGILSKSPLNIEGDGMLVVTNEDKTHTAIEAPQLTVNQCIIKAEGKRALSGDATGSLDIQASTIIASGTEWGIGQFTAFNPTDVIITSPKNAYFSSELKGIAQNNVLCKDVKIEEDLLLNENFEEVNDGEIPEGWKIVDGDGDGQCWKTLANRVATWFIPHSGAKGIISMSWENFKTYNPNNYLITPKVDGAYKLKYYFAINPVAHSDHYAVMASTTNDNPENFSIVFEETGTELPFIKGSESQSEWIERVVMLPEGTQHIAFCHFNCTDQNYVLLDDIKVYRGIATRVNDLHTDSASSIEGYYDLMGRKFDAMQPGINIVKLKNGQVHKLFQK